MEKLRAHESVFTFTKEISLQATVVDKHTSEMITAESRTQLVEENIKTETLYVPKVVKPGLSFTAFVSQTCKDFYLISIADILFCFINYQIKVRKYDGELLADDERENLSLEVSTR